MKIVIKKIEVRNKTDGLEIKELDSLELQEQYGSKVDWDSPEIKNQVESLIANYEEDKVYYLLLSLQYIYFHKAYSDYPDEILSKINLLDVRTCYIQKIIEDI